VTSDILLIGVVSWISSTVEVKSYRQIFLKRNTTKQNCRHAKQEVIERKLSAQYSERDERLVDLLSRVVNSYRLNSPSNRRKKKRKNCRQAELSSMVRKLGARHCSMSCC